MTPIRLAPQTLSAAGSILLDVLRFGAACVVLFCHFSHPLMSEHLPNLATAGHLAVAVFFVLSGFVIRYVTLTRETTAKEFLINRASRIYSVVVPALVITVICESAAWSINPHYYSLVSLPFTWSDVPFQLFTNLIFQSQNWGYEIIPLSNSPFWSLAFECFYYVIYGLCFYRVRGMVPLCFLVLIVGGPSVALMFPVWLMGSLAFDFYSKLSASALGLRISSISLAGTLLGLFMARVRIRAFLIAVNEEHRTAWISRGLIGVPHHEIFFRFGRLPWLTNASASFFVVGLVMALFTVWALLLVDRLLGMVSVRMARWFRFVAEGTFALYLLHLPLLILIVCAAGGPIRSNFASALGLTAIIVVCVCIAIPMDAFKRRLRNQMGASVRSA